MLHGGGHICTCESHPCHAHSSRLLPLSVLSLCVLWLCLCAPGSKQLRALMPHSKKDVKIDRKDRLSEMVPEICEMKNCNNCLYFEMRKKQDLYLWLGKMPHGPTIKFHVQNSKSSWKGCLLCKYFLTHFLRLLTPCAGAEWWFETISVCVCLFFERGEYALPIEACFVVLLVLLPERLATCSASYIAVLTRHRTESMVVLPTVHTMDELKMSGNALKGSRPLLNFESVFDQVPELMLMKELLFQAFGTPRSHPKSKPFVDRVMSFFYLDGRVWVRNFQVKWSEDRKNPDDHDLAEIGPRFCLQPIRIFEGAFGGKTLFENSEYVSPNEVCCLLVCSRATFLTCSTSGTCIHNRDAAGGGGVFSDCD